MHRHGTAQAHKHICNMRQHGAEHTGRGDRQNIAQVTAKTLHVEVTAKGVESKYGPLLALGRLPFLIPSCLEAAALPHLLVLVLKLCTRQTTYWEILPPTLLQHISSTGTGLHTTRAAKTCMKVLVSQVVHVRAIQHMTACLNISLLSRSGHDSTCLTL